MCLQRFEKGCSAIPITFLGLESSCDETAAAVVRLTEGERPCILSNVVLSQLDDHRPYGGVVPEIAARAHVAHMDRVVVHAMEQAGLRFQDLDGVAATAGPGLIGGVIVGLMSGKAIALTHSLPFLAVNHLEGHALSARLSDDVSFPFLLLLISGGHCQLIEVEDVGRYRRLGTTLDDAVGEAFDKTAKILGLGYPGGAAVERRAREGDPFRFPFPVPLTGRAGCDFSFSGLKTAVRQTFEALETDNALSDQDLADLAASFQETVARSLEDRTAHAMDRVRIKHGGGGRTPSLVVAGGVAANGQIRSRMLRLCEERGFRFVAPPAVLCTDNGAMIAWAGLERFRLGVRDSLDQMPRARWPLGETVSANH